MLLAGRSDGRRARPGGGLGTAAAYRTLALAWSPPQEKSIQLLLLLLPSPVSYYATLKLALMVLDIPQKESSITF